MTDPPSLKGFLDALNAHDVDANMSFFTGDCVFDMPRGPAPGGRRLVGKEQLRGKISRKDSSWKTPDEPSGGSSVRTTTDHPSKRLPPAPPAP